MQLIGSTTSPYVRRIRILLADTAYDFDELGIVTPEDRAKLQAQNPTLKVPMLKDNDQLIYDSRIIANYVSKKLKMPALSWDQENLLSLIDSVNDSLVQMFLLKLSGLDTTQDARYFNMQRERYDAVFKELNKQAEAGAFAQWHYPSICLYALLDWVLFRELYDLSAQPALLAFHQQHAKSPIAVATDPR